MKYADTEDLGLPDVRTLRSGKRTARKERKLKCGHIIRVGEWYIEWVGIIDGEFTVDHDCQHCWLERMD